jgi:hypothetical protein
MKLLKTSNPHETARRLLWVVPRICDVDSSKIQHRQAEEKQVEYKVKLPHESHVTNQQRK